LTSFVKLTHPTEGETWVNLDHIVTIVESDDCTRLWEAGPEGTGALKAAESPQEILNLPRI